MKNISDADLKSKESEIYKTIWESYKDSICLMDIKGKILQCNKAMTKLLHKPASKIKGKTCWELIHGTSKAIKGCPIARMQKTRKRETLVLQVNDKWLQVTVDPIIDKNKKLIGAVHIISDITERKKTEEALKESEKKYRTLVENLPQKIFFKDRNSVYISCNENYAKDLKIKPEEIAGRTDYEFYPKKLAEKYRGDDKRIMKAGKTEDIEEEYIQDGKKVFVHTVKTPIKDEKGNIIGILGIFWDITEKKKAEERLQHFQKVVDESSDAIGMSTPKGKHYYQNQSFNELFGLSVEETEGKKGPPSTVYADEKVGREVFKTIMKGDSWTGEVEMFTKARNKIHVFLRAYAIKDENGKVIGLIGIHTNITEKKKAEEEIKKRVEELEKFSKFAVGRELKMVELKKEINELYKKLGEKPRYTEIKRG